MQRSITGFNLVLLGENILRRTGTSVESKGGAVSAKQNISVGNDGAITSTSSISVDNWMKAVIGDFTVSNTTTTRNGAVQSNSTTFEGSVKATNIVKAPFSIGLRKTQMALLLWILKPE